MRNAVERGVTEYHKKFRIKGESVDKAIKGDDFYIRISESEVKKDDQLPINFD